MNRSFILPKELRLGVFYSPISDAQIGLTTIKWYELLYIYYQEVIWLNDDINNVKTVFKRRGERRFSPKK